MKTQDSKLKSVAIVALGVLFSACSAEPRGEVEPPPEGATVLEPLSGPGAAREHATRGHTCGGIAGLTCKPGEYCEFPSSAQCGAADRTGTCKLVPESCRKIYAPVCGCDGSTYSSACVAASRGVSVASRGACSVPTGKLCGGIAGIACADSQYCDYPPSAHCGAGDMSGTCEDVPQLCTDIYEPVCGCDGKTYSSSCVAARSGVSVAEGGACASTSTPEGAACGTLGAPGKCADGLYCAYGKQCGAEDSGGSCTTQPTICPDFYLAVCGCDGRVYANSCYAARSGTSVAYQGACKAP